jgi:hypothetical protein
MNIDEHGNLFLINLEAQMRMCYSTPIVFAADVLRA